MSDPNYELDRRDYLKLSGAIGLLGVAGCVEPPQAEKEHHEENKHKEKEGHGHGHTGYEEPKEHAEVKMKTLGEPEHGSRYHFEPHVAWIKEGGHVTWHNESGAHTTTAYSPDNDKPLRIPDEQYSWDSGMLTEQGATYEESFEEEGVYDYFCMPHEGMGMLGTVVVGEPDLEHEAGMEPPQDELPQAAQEKIKELNAKVEKMLGDENHEDDHNHHHGEESGHKDGHGEHG